MEKRTLSHHRNHPQLPRLPPCDRGVLGFLSSGWVNSPQNPQCFGTRISGKAASCLQTSPTLTLRAHRLGFSYVPATRLRCAVVRSLIQKAYPPVPGQSHHIRWLGEVLHLMFSFVLQEENCGETLKWTKKIIWCLQEKTMCLAHALPGYLIL